MKLFFILIIFCINFYLSTALDENNCYWSGTAPFCNGKCQGSYSVLNNDKYGNGKKCWTGIKVYCCYTP